MYSFWDYLCAFSLVGIWPRFVEPTLLSVTRLEIPVKNLSRELTLVQLSDLHFHEQVPDRFLQKILKKLEELRPDLLVFTGDFLCFGQLPDKERLKAFLKGCKAPKGCFAILGNHDYAQGVSFNEAGDYDLLERRPGAVLAGLKRLFHGIVPTGHITDRAKAVPFNQELMELLSETPFRLLHNETVFHEGLNICGLGEYMLGRCQPEIAFRDYQKDSPGIILSHNPDSIPLLEKFPGELILSGHTHGGQINLPWLWKRFTILENAKYARAGIHLADSKKIYISRGFGSVVPFRFNSVPELVHITLRKG